MPQILAEDICYEKRVANPGDEFESKDDCTVILFPLGMMAFKKRLDRKTDGWQVNENASPHSGCSTTINIPSETIK